MRSDEGRKFTVIILDPTLIYEEERAFILTKILIATEEILNLILLPGLHT